MIGGNRTWVAAVLPSVLAVLAATPVAAGDASRPSLKDSAVPAPLARSSHAPVEFGFYGDQRGCYWRRGDRKCSRYCYWETDGHRYCTDKERYAYPQGDPWFVASPPEPPIYLRPPYARP